MPVRSVSGVAVLAALAVAVLVPQAADAQRAHRSQAAEDWADSPYNPHAPPGAAIRALSRRNQEAPGVTNELAPENKATASGGPSGGVPGFSGH